MAGSCGDPVRGGVGSGNLVICSRIGGGRIRRGTAGRGFYLGWGYLWRHCFGLLKWDSYRPGS